jgi:hypothetical protein
MNHCGKRRHIRASQPLAVHGFPTVDMRADDDADGMLL